MRRAMVIAAVALLAGACSPQTVKTEGESAKPEAKAPAKAAPAKKTATIGTAISLKGQSDTQVRVTVVKLVYPAQGKDEYTKPEAGKVFAAVQVRMENTGTAAYSDAPSNGAKLIDSQGQSFDADITAETTAGPNISSNMNLAPGGSQLGYIAFQVPNGTRLATFQLTLNSGFGGETGQWTISG